MLPTVRVVAGVAVPASEWRQVPKGVACPRGCEFRMDLTQGVNMIRTLQPATQEVLGPTRLEQLRQRVMTRFQGSKTIHGGDANNSRCKTADIRELLLRPQGRPSGGLQVAPRSVPAPRSVTTTEPQALQIRPQSQSSRGVVTVGGKKFRSVQRESMHSRVEVGADGSREDARIAVQSRALVRRDRGSGGKTVGERMSARKEQSVRRLADGRSVVTETVILKKVTVLPRQPAVCMM